MKDIVWGRAELKFGATRDLGWNVWGAVLIGLVLSAMVAYAQPRPVDDPQSPAVDVAPLDEARGKPLDEALGRPLDDARGKQGRPDFTGTWVVEKVELPERPEGGAGRAPGGMGGRGGQGGMGGGMRGGGRGGMGAGRGGMRGRGGEAGGPGGGMFRARAMQAGDEIRVKQTADRLIVTEKAEGGERMSIYALDGSETTNFVDRGSVRSKAKWEGVALVINSTQRIETPMGEMTLEMREVRSLSGDGLTMTVVNTLDTPRGKMTTTVTYVKATESESE